MAERAIALLLTKLVDPIIGEAILLYGVSDDVGWLVREMRWMESFLRDAEVKRRRDRNNLINNWVREVREIAEEAEDIIDTFRAAIEPQRRLQRRIGGHHPHLQSILRYTSALFELSGRHKVGAGIQQLRAKIQQIKNSREACGLINLGETSTTRSTDDEALHARRCIAPRLDNDNHVLVGFDNHKKIIMEQLLDEDIKQRCVVSIVGAGGMGKTTLATKIYNNSKIRAGFDTHVCVSVSQIYQYGDMLRRIAKQVMGADRPNMPIDDLEGELNEFLKERRYLIILDDVWSQDVWNRTSKVLPDMKNRSRVLITTRSMEVATSAGPCTRPYPLPFLNDEQSWELFLKNAFPQNQNTKPLCCPERLEDVGYKLVKRCGGLPLALIVLGGLLSRKDSSRAEWVRVIDRLDWSSTKDGQNCLDILALSYEDLPHHHLRSCFLYLAVYPEDAKIPEAEVVNLWIAEGFIPQTKTRSMEEIARSYLNEFVGRSMIQPNYDFWKPYPTYRVHDLFRDFCINETRNDGFLSIHCKNSFLGEMRVDPSHCRRLALHNFFANEVNDRFPAPSVRSLLTFGTKLNNDKIFKGLNLLRVVHLQIDRATRFPKKLVESSIHLRYLCLTGLEELTKLPSSMGSFCNLQTLDVRCAGIKRLPDSIGKIQTLRHLYLPHNCDCPSAICKLTNLKTLTHPGAGGGWIEHGLEKLINIEQLHARRVRTTQAEIFFHSLRKMKSLTDLRLYINYEDSIPADSFKGFSDLHQLFVMKLHGKISGGHLVLPPNLTTLTLEECELVQDPIPVLEKLPNLATLRLSFDRYIGPQMFCTAGGFSNLQRLAVVGLRRLKDWRIECGAMPKLIHLRIEHCLNLAMLPEGLEHLKSFKILEVTGLREAFRRRLEREVGDDWYKIQHVPTIKISRL